MRRGRVVLRLLDGGILELGGQWEKGGRKIDGDTIR